MKLFVFLIILFHLINLINCGSILVLDALQGNAGTGKYRGYSINFDSTLGNNYAFSFQDNCVLSITRKTQGVTTNIWSNVETAPTRCFPSAYFSIGTDGNICTKLHENDANPNWCLMTNSLGARYLYFDVDVDQKEYNLKLTTDSYRMVWGLTSGSSQALALVKGAYIDKNDPNNNKLTVGGFITNGRHYLRVDTNGQLQLINGNFNNAGAPILWQSIVPPSSVPAPYVFKVIEGGNACLVGGPNEDIQYFCTNTLNQNSRYVSVPLLNGNGIDWGFMVQEFNLEIVGGFFSIPKNKYPGTSSSFNSQWFCYVVSNDQNIQRRSCTNYIVSDTASLFFRGDGELSFSSGVNAGRLQNVTIYGKPNPITYVSGQSPIKGYYAKFDKSGFDSEQDGSLYCSARHQSSPPVLDYLSLKVNPNIPYSVSNSICTMNSIPYIMILKTNGEMVYKQRIIYDTYDPSGPVPPWQGVI